ncbi:hypothetical protein KQ313_10130 [Synechococcus sp. CS-1325]|uniref:hypothetical protein n=1 Tax=unclassified Synechococcus TaxID=2626047 RepID=UPI000DB66BA3|nr:MULTISPECIES: hypothetical protein [unclassified Synechococcus]PZU98606.1 MAG: hypothetical protein DCF24_10560 [Cyanobium sp.]MCT0200035.1 hypothetical protein [Synechococcus sp. CS-1325]MCT0212405.1 hypothetical protein [Synechococcus sp. CS-1326]MCT0229354.1 hypothetical protein [Synechococcus sp. CS-1324]MCT0234588.1 hypothetical protein [Synechococcus sp. CS-1327]
MGQRPSCRSCSHCLPPAGSEAGWCKLRRLAIHAEWSGELSCHHWTLPVNGGNEGSHQRFPVLAQARADQQLCLADLLDPVPA